MITFQMCLCARDCLCIRIVPELLSQLEEMEEQVMEAFGIQNDKRKKKPDAAETAAINAAAKAATAAADAAAEAAEAKADARAGKPKSEERNALPDEEDKDDDDEEEEFTAEDYLMKPPKTQAEAEAMANVRARRDPEHIKRRRAQVKRAAERLASELSPRDAQGRLRWGDELDETNEVVQVRSRCV